MVRHSQNFFSGMKFEQADSEYVDTETSNKNLPIPQISEEKSDKSNFNKSNSEISNKKKGNMPLNNPKSIESNTNWLYANMKNNKDSMVE